MTSNDFEAYMLDPHVAKHLTELVIGPDLHRSNHQGAVDERRGAAEKCLEAFFPSDANEGIEHPSVVPPQVGGK